MRFFTFLIFLLGTFPAFSAWAYFQQEPGNRFVPKPNKTGIAHKKRIHLFTGQEQVDVLDILNILAHKNAVVRKDTTGIKSGKLHLSLLPSLEYTLQTGFAGAIYGNAGFYTSNQENSNISNVLAVFKYTQKNQILVPIIGNIWTKENKYNILTDWHIDKFPQETYGLGGFTKESDGYLIDYTYIRLYETLLKTITPDFYLGFGYDFDYYFHISEVNPPAGVVTDFEKYGLSNKSVSAGFTLNLLYDTRRNSINPIPGYYANVIFRPNFTFLGSDVNYQSLLVDLRKYIHLPNGSKNILAFWSYDFLTLGGKPPYLQLPTTAGDTYNNLGRGYIQGRYRGPNLVYLESEYRFGITSNGLIGAAIFLNAQSFSELDNHRFEVILPGWGAGIRIKLNKFSRTNVCLDYGFGLHGSNGIFANLGEVF